MRLYHGTTAAVAKLALTEGLRPRADTGLVSNWTEHPSRADLVYLTAAYAPYFALCVTPEDERAGIVEVDSDLLDWAAFCPDEDFLDQAGKELKMPADVGRGMDERTAWFRENIEDFRDYSEASLEGLGNVAYQGDIPPEAVLRVVTFDPDWNRGIMRAAMDPAITILNYRHVGHKYRALTEWFMGGPGDLSQIVDGIEHWTHFDPVLGAEMRRQWEAALADRSGWELLKAEAA